MYAKWKECMVDAMSTQCCLLSELNAVICSTTQLQNIIYEQGENIHNICLIHYVDEKKPQLLNKKEQYFEAKNFIN